MASTSSSRWANKLHHKGETLPVDTWHTAMVDVILKYHIHVHKVETFNGQNFAVL